MANRRQVSRGDEHPQALIYTRVSSDEQAREGLSLPAQLVACRRYCAGKGWGIEAEEQDILKGTRDDRPGYQRLLSRVRQLRSEGRACVVVTPWLHRFGRKVLERVRCREELKTLGVATHSVHEGGEVSDLVANILASVAEEEVRQLSERVSTTTRDIQDKGWFKGGKASWGYQMRPATDDERKAGSPKGVLDVNDAEAPYAREAYARAAAGESLRSIARWAAGLPNEARGGRRLGYSGLQFILSEPVYVARQRYGADKPLERPVCRWPALVDDVTWARVQERIAGHQRVPRQASQRHLLTGFMRCPTCGARMTGEAPPTRNGKVLQVGRYRCQAHLGGVGVAVRSCTYTANMPRVDEAVLAEVGKVMTALATKGPFLTALRKAWAEIESPPQAVDTARRIRQQEAEVAKAQQRLQAATYKLLDGTIDDETYRATKGDIERTRDSAAAELTRLRGANSAPALPPLDKVLEKLGGWQDAVAKFDRARQREILGELIERVEPIRTAVGRRRGVRSSHVAKIHWTPQGDALRGVAATASQRAA